MSWPHKGDGTIDWDTVFDDPEIGLVPYMERAKTPEAMNLCAHIIVHSLFIREQDEPYRKAFNAMIDELIQSTEASDGQRAHDLIMKLVREIKANRVKHAQRYLDAGEPDHDPEHSDETRRTEHDPTDALQALEGDGSA